jgi:hypothetical protein
MEPYREAMSATESMPRGIIHREHSGAGLLNYSFEQVSDICRKTR